MDRLKRRATIMLIAAQALALLTPAYIVMVEPSSAVYRSSQSHWSRSSSPGGWTASGVRRN